jgi:hypothetical protein
MKNSAIAGLLMILHACVMAGNLTLSGTISSDGTYPSDADITATTTISSSATVVFSARGTITLQPGFTAAPASGKTFTAVINTTDPAPSSGSINFYTLNPNFAANQLGKFYLDPAGTTATYRSQISVPSTHVTPYSTIAYSTYGGGYIYLFNGARSSGQIAKINPANGSYNTMNLTLSSWPANASLCAAGSTLVLFDPAGYYSTMDLTANPITNTAWTPLQTPPAYPAQAFAMEGGVSFGYYAPYGGNSGLMRCWSGSFVSVSLSSYSTYTAAESKLAAGDGLIYLMNPNLSSNQIIGFNETNCTPNFYPGGSAIPTKTISSSYVTNQTAITYVPTSLGGSRSVGGNKNINQPPVIESTPWAEPGHIRLPDTTSVNVIAFDPDNNPEPLTYTWSKVLGPGTVTFSGNGTADAASSTAAFDQPGTYVLRVTVSDGLDETSGDVLVTVEKAKKQ